MQFLDNLSIKAKVAIAFSAVLLVTVGLGVFAIARLGQVNGTAEEIAENNLPSIRELSKMQAMIERYRAQQAQFILSDSDAAMDDMEKRMQSTVEAFEQAYKTYQPLIAPGEEQAMMDDFISKWRQYQADSRDLFALARNA